MRPLARSSQIDGNQGVIFMIISKHAGYEAEGVGKLDIYADN